MMRWLMRSFGWSYLSDEEISTIAKAHCAAMGWPWIEPVFFSNGVTRTRLRTQANMRGGNVNIVIDARTGAVRSAGFARR